MLVRRTSRPFWCCVFLSRCLIYKVHAPFSRSADVLFILALSFLLVKNFFKFFSELFRSKPLDFVLFQARSRLPTRTRLVYHALSSLSSTFFIAKQTFFDPEVRRSKKQTAHTVCFLCWRYLSSRPVSRQVFSSQAILTSVFGMGTGGPSPQSTPTYFLFQKKVSKENFN